MEVETLEYLLEREKYSLLPVKMIHALGWRKAQRSLALISRIYYREREQWLRSMASTMKTIHKTLYL